MSQGIQITIPGTKASLSYILCTLSIVNGYAQTLTMMGECQCRRLLVAQRLVASEGVRLAARWTRRAG